MYGLNISQSPVLNTITVHRHVVSSKHSPILCPLNVQLTPLYLQWQYNLCLPYESPFHCVLQVTDPSLLRFLVDMRGADPSDKQLRDDLMTMLIAGHETTAAVLTWTLFLLMQHPEIAARVVAEVDSVLTDELPSACSPPQPPKCAGFFTRHYC